MRCVLAHTCWSKAFGVAFRVRSKGTVKRLTPRWRATGPAVPARTEELLRRLRAALRLRGLEAVHALRQRAAQRLTWAAASCDDTPERPRVPKTPRKDPKHLADAGGGASCWCSNASLEVVKIFQGS